MYRGILVPSDDQPCCEARSKALLWPGPPKNSVQQATWGYLHPWLDLPTSASIFPSKAHSPGGTPNHQSRCLLELCPVDIPGRWGGTTQHLNPKGDGQAGWFPLDWGNNRTCITFVIKWQLPSSLIYWFIHHKSQPPTCHSEFKDMLRTVFTPKKSISEQLQGYGKPYLSLNLHLMQRLLYESHTFVHETGTCVQI